MPARRKKSNQTEVRPALSGLELEVMLVVWDLGECTSGDVIEAFRSRRDLAASTLRNVLLKLRTKGYLKPIPTVGRGFLLRATVQRRAVEHSTLKSVLESFFEGSPQQAIASLLDANKITNDELDEIRRMIEARKRRGGAR
ncbi:MAG: BlaI/MecI/CopY family transcriptional regulator [Planctomycetes bacterium]|nr:BlaI/MecI/CopY family transcriptional regulator [Planctomycetota bacterium]